MTSSLYTYEKLNFNGYEAYFLKCETNGLFRKRKMRYVPTLSNYIVDVKNNMTKASRFPQEINESNFFHFIHAEDKSRLDEFTREYPDIKMYVEQLKQYFKSVEDEKKYMLYADLIVPK